MWILEKSTNLQYLNLEAKMEKSKTNLFSKTLEDSENKVALFFSSLAFRPRYWQLVLFTLYLHLKTRDIHKIFKIKLCLTFLVGSVFCHHLNNRTNVYSYICHLDLYHKPTSFFKDFTGLTGLGCIFLLLLLLAGWMGGLSETGNKANLSLSLSLDWAWQLPEPNLNDLST